MYRKVTGSREILLQNGWTVDQRPRSADICGDEYKDIQLVGTSTKILSGNGILIVRYANCGSFGYVEVRLDSVLISKIPPQVSDSIAIVHFKDGQVLSISDNGQSSAVIKLISLYTVSSADNGLNDLGSYDTLLNNGWSFTNISHHNTSSYGSQCDHSSFYGFGLGTTVGTMVHQLHGEGTALIDVENCLTVGTVAVTLDNVNIGTGKQIFKYKTGQTIKIQESDGIIKLRQFFTPNSFNKPGSFKKSYQCMECPVGKYSDEEGLGSCKPCETGRYQNENRQRSCKTCSVCSAGKFHFSTFMLLLANNKLTIILIPYD